MRHNLGDEARLRHIWSSIIAIESYVNKDDVTFDIFENHSMMKYAAIKQLEIIGEAENYISTDLKSEFNRVEWQKIIRLRNILIHEYFGVDDRVIWDVVTIDIPIFKREIESILIILFGEAQPY